MRWPSREPGSIRRRRPGLASRRWWPFLVPALVLAVSASLLSAAGRHQWALSLFRQPTYYTALYFGHASMLPSALVRGQRIPVSFYVRNEEGGPVDYQYVVTSSDGIYTDVLKQSRRTVAAGATWKVFIRVRPGCRLTPCRIEVALPGHLENIDFLMSLIPGRAKHA